MDENESPVSLPTLSFRFRSCSCVWLEGESGFSTAESEAGFVSWVREEEEGELEEFEGDARW